ncbi:uncharacterized protein RAG0_08769 [Rhynchosporium agropyri]|uniref:Uncharacterized protein n=1 Tax=Rhynchosporium agropyri TaxID=914238 RepID=A0A1E1KSB2_9HELO|nr:uncharacterized protein RAG0_08769 [Rhynchosporium agropyri]
MNAILACKSWTKKLVARMKKTPQEKAQAKARKGVKRPQMFMKKFKRVNTQESVGSFEHSLMRRGNSY